MSLSASGIQEAFKRNGESIIITRLPSQPDEFGGKTRCKCPFCDDVFLFVSALAVHLQESHDKYINQLKKVSYTCHYCNKVISTRDFLRKHVKSHLRPSVKCTKCLIAFDDQKALETHECCPNSATCESCGKTYASEARLKAHIYRVHDSEPLKCKTCNLLCKNKTYLQRHEETHSDIVCPICAKSMTRSRLSQHMLIHGEKKYACEQCPKKFAQPAGLIQHKRIHGENKKVEYVEPAKRTCDLCGTVFSYLSGLYIHKKQVHGEGRCYFCLVCGKSCGTRRALEEHKMVHSDDRPQVCQTCGASFKMERALIDHVKRKHGLTLKYSPIIKVE